MPGGRGPCRARVAALLAAAFMMMTWTGHSFVSLPSLCRRGQRVLPGGHHGAAGPARDRYLSMSTSNSEKKKGKGRRRARGKRENGAPEGGRKELSEGGSLSDRDSDLDAFIEDERKSTLPRLEDLKRIKSITAGSIPAEKVKDEGPGNGNLLLPRELEELKKKEKQKEPPKGAPPYFDTMTKITWAAIATMIIVEVVIHSPLVHLPESASTVAPAVVSLAQP